MEDALKKALLWFIGITLFIAIVSGVDTAAGFWNSAIDGITTFVNGLEGF